jgi:hypothetical protein
VRKRADLPSCGYKNPKYLQEWLSLDKVRKRADLPSDNWKELVQKIPTLE